MRLYIADRKEFCAGLLFAAIGVTAGILSCGYRLGEATRMGPGYFPLLLSVVLTALGLAAMVKGLRARVAAPLGRWPWVPLFFVVCGVVGFGLLIDSRGLALAVLLLTVLSCYGRLRGRPLEVAVISVVLVVFTVGVFIYGLGMPFYLFR